MTLLWRGEGRSLSSLDTSIFEKLLRTLLAMSSIRNQISHLLYLAPTLFLSALHLPHPITFLPIPTALRTLPLPTQTPPYLCPYPPPTSDPVFYAYSWSQLRTHLYFITSKVYAVTVRMLRIFVLCPEAIRRKWTLLSHSQSECCFMT